MKALEKFASQFGARLHLNKNLIVEKQDKYFLLNDNLKCLIGKNFFYAGAYLGKTRKERFFPSFVLLRMIVEKKGNKTTVDAKTAWLFICGRDIFKQGIINAEGSKKKGTYTLVLNEHGECLGFGRIAHNLDEQKGEVAIKNITDIGDFLRREK